MLARMARVLIVHHKWDADVADPLAEGLQLYGHTPVRHVAGEQSLAEPADDQTPMVLVWSGALAVDAAGLREAGLLAAGRKPVLLRIDDTEPPQGFIDTASVVTASAAQGLEIHAAVMRALALQGDPGSSSQRFRLLPWRMASVRAGKAGVAVAALMLAGLAFGAWFWSERRAPGLALAAQSKTDGLRARHVPAHEARALMQGLLAGEDPLALRAAVQVLGDAPEAQALRARLAFLEDRAWREAAGTADAAGRLLAIEAFRASFPGSSRMSGAMEAMVSEARDDIVSAQSDLSALGFAAGPANGVMTPQTEAAVRAFQAAKALPATGLIDARLLSALEAASAPPAPIAAARSADLTDLGGGDAASRAGARGGSPSRDGRLSRLAEARQTTPAALTLIQDCPLCPGLVVLPRGEGQVGDAGTSGDPTERPVRMVTLDYGLAMGRYEVTVLEWSACVADGGCPPDRSRPASASGRAPVTGVSFEEAKLYAAWLRHQTGHGYRLPSEAEWEYAARAGARSVGVSDPSQGLCALANVADRESVFPDRDETCRDGFPTERAPVGQFTPNAFGLYDMRGNVWEWTEDCWHASYRGAPGSPAPWLRRCETSDRVLRGGSYRTGPRHNRLSARLPVPADQRMGDVGFRVVRPVADAGRAPF
jgi:formylglycine-generating enzyme required for sulfatase activity